MTSNFKIIDFKTLGKRDINGFLNEKADDVWYDGRYGNPVRSVRMIATVYFPENFKDTLINEGLKVLARKRVEYKNRNRPSFITIINIVELLPLLIMLCNLNNPSK